MSPAKDFKPDAQALSKLLSARPMQRLIRGTQNQQVLEQLLTDVVPEPVYDNITSCQLDYGILTIGVSTASWATRLRAQRHDILYAAERHRSLGRLKDLKIVIRPAKAEKPKPRKKQHAPPKPLSHQTVEMVQAAAGGCENDELKCALSRLAANMQVYTDKKGSS
jgi:hypothetical protein